MKLNVQGPYARGSEMNAIIDELREYAEAEGSELGEDCLWLLNGAQRVNFSAEFIKALGDEIKAQAKFFRENFYIQETKETQEYTVVELVQK